MSRWTCGTRGEDLWMQGKGRSLSISTSTDVVDAGAAVLEPSSYLAGPAAPQVRSGGAALGWYAIWTRSHSEQLVSDQLDAKGFEVFLPKTSEWSQRRGVRRRVEAPLFPGYLFVRHAIDKHSYLEIISARGVVRVLGERWDRLEVVDSETISGLRRFMESGVPVQAHPHLTSGARVRVTGGPFEGLCGVFVRERPAKGLFVLTIDLLQRSVAVEIDCAFVEAA